MGNSVRRTSNHSQQGLLREEVLRKIVSLSEQSSDANLAPKRFQRCPNAQAE